MKQLITVLTIIVIIMLWLNYIKNNFNYNFMWHINITDWCENTRKHEVSHTIYKNLSKEDKISYLYKINSGEFLWETYWSFISKELIRVDNIYNMQIFFNKTKLQQELFAYYIQMKIN